MDETTNVTRKPGNSVSYHCIDAQTDVLSKNDASSTLASNTFNDFFQTADTFAKKQTVCETKQNGISQEKFEENANKTDKTSSCNTDIVLVNKNEFLQLENKNSAHNLNISNTNSEDIAPEVESNFICYLISLLYSIYFH